MPPSTPATPEDRLAALLARRDEHVAPDDDDPRPLVSGGWTPNDEVGAVAPSQGVATRPRFFTTPSAFAGARVRPASWAVAGLAAVVVVAGTIFGVRVWLADASSRPTAVPTSAATERAAGEFTRAQPSSTSTTAGRRSTATSAPSSSPGVSAVPEATSGPVVVQVAGAVRRPGVVTLPAGSRVVDAVTKCGGTLVSADLASVNLARPVADGEQIIVSTRGAAPPQGAPAAQQATTGRDATAGVTGRSGGTGDGAGSPRAAGGGGAPSGPVDLNTADVATLDTLPGVGPVLAQRIVDFRTQNGSFTSVEQLGDVEGVGDKTLERLTPLVRV